MVGDHTGILGAVVLSVFLAWWCGSVVLNHILEVHLVATISRRHRICSYPFWSTNCLV
jgi:hypothetical protein